MKYIGDSSPFIGANRILSALRHRISIYQQITTSGQLTVCSHKDLLMIKQSMVHHHLVQLS
ncbi:hypothetical protein ACRS6K_12550 [Bacillus cytotoxicus]|uniref:hypothetical protein n=1 Tax=Bacillus cytotoxicus TaxID=580165 RepID=UPI0015C50B16|nr:hypothetical protein [Bacillus cytotoxicus]MDH2892252.1 hypothetical protein [Bacillus cytotoxicus]HDR7209602.1 hypothetical protein [Bacillus cytotoxicus]